MSKSAKQLLVKLNRRIKAVRAAIDECVITGTESASISAGNGSKSYSRIPLPQLRELEADLCAQRRALKLQLAGGCPITHVVTVRG